MKIYLVMCVFPVTTLVIQPWRLPDWMKCVNVMTTMNQRTDGRKVRDLPAVNTCSCPPFPPGFRSQSRWPLDTGWLQRSWKTWTKVMKDVDKGHERRGQRSWKTWTKVMKDVDKCHERRGQRSWKTWTKVMKDVDKGHERRGQRSWKTWTKVMKDVDQGHERRGQKSDKMWTVDYLMWGVHRQLLDRPPESCVDKPWQTDL